MRKAKICKIPIQKWPNYIINTKLKVGIIFIKLWELAFNYKAKWSTKANLYYESIENFGITLHFISHFELKIAEFSERGGYIFMVSTYISSLFIWHHLKPFSELWLPSS